VQFDQLEQLIGQLHAAGFGHAAGVRQVRLQGVRQVVGVHHLAEHLAVAADAAEAGAGDVHAVVTAGAADELALARLTFQAPVGAGHFHCRVGALGAGAGEEYMVEVAGHQRGNLFGQAERQRVAVLEARRVVQAAQLLGHRLLDFAAAVAGAAGPQAGQAVEHLATLVIDQGVAVGADNDARIALEGAVGGKGHPVGVQLELAGDDGVGAVRQVHGRSRRRREGLPAACHGHKVSKTWLL